MSIIFASHTYQDGRVVMVPIRGMSIHDGTAWRTIADSDQMYHDGQWSTVFAPTAEDLVPAAVWIEDLNLGSIQLFWSGEYYCNNQNTYLIKPNGPSIDVDLTYWYKSYTNGANTAISDFCRAEMYNGSPLPLHLSNVALTRRYVI